MRLHRFFKISYLPFEKLSFTWLKLVPVESTLFYFENQHCVHSVWLCVTAYAQGRVCAQGTVGVCECVLVRGRAKKTCRGVESGVIPALFKTTCQHGIRPGPLRWRPRSSVSAVGLLPPPRPRSSLGFHCSFNSESEDFLQGRKL